MGLEIQDGAVASSVKGTSCGTDKMKDLGPRTSKLTKPQGKEAPKDMIYYAQKRSGTLRTEQPSHSEGKHQQQPDMQAATHSEH